MRRNLKGILLICFAFNTILTFGQSVKGRIIDKLTKQEQPALLISLDDADHIVYTNALGNFNFAGVETGEHTLLTKLGGQWVKITSFTFNGGELDLGTLEADVPSSNLAGNEISIIDVIDLAGIEGENDNVSSVLAASRDPFVNAAAFNLGNGRFRPRGYFNEDSEMMMNGMVMNDQDDGRVLWTAWSGLNDVLRNQTQIINQSMNDYTFGGIGGGTFVDLRASNQRKIQKAVYTLSNRSYQHRLMFTKSSGLMENGWAYIVALSHRYAEQGYVKGTHFEGTSYFLSVDRKINTNHSLNAVLMGTPQRRGRSTGSFQEMYDIAGTNFYNGNWGYQNGEVRSAREYRINQPIAMLRHDWKVGKFSHIFTTIGVQWGTFGSTRLDWYDAPDPRADYYRRLPSNASDPVTRQNVLDYLSADENNRQIDWAGLYEANSTRDYTFNNVNGDPNQSISGKFAAYVLEAEHYDNQKLSYNSTLNTRINDKLNLTGSLQYLREKVHYYRQLEDLLGADFYMDFNRFAVRDFPGDNQVLQNDLDNPNRVIREGDKFGHNYAIVNSKVSAFGQLLYKTNKFDVGFAINAAQQQFYREGYTRVGIFPESSLGKSQVYDFFNYGVKGSVTYKIDGRNYIVATGSHRTRSPYANESFVSPRVRDQVVNNLTNEKITAFDLSYHVRYTNFKGRISGFLTDFKDRITSDVYYNEEFQTFVNYLMSGINKRHVGLEAGMEFNLNNNFSVLAAGSLGDFRYTSRPKATISRDNSAEGFVQDRTVYINNYYVPGMPQNAGTLGLKYNRNQTWVNVNVNFFGKNYLQFNPDRRTEKGVEGLDPIEQAEKFKEIIDLEKLPNAMTVDLFLGKTIRLKNRNSLSINLNVGNLLNTKNFITGGFEQLRFDFESKEPSRFPPRYFYAFGTNYSFNISYTFN